MKNFFLSASTRLHTLPSRSFTHDQEILRSVRKHLPLKNLHPTETYQLTCTTSHLTDFHMRQALNVRCFQKDIKQTQEIISQIILMLATYFLHSLHGQVYGFPVLMAFLKAVKDSFCQHRSQVAQELQLKMSANIFGAIPLDTSYKSRFYYIIIYV